MNYNFYGVLLNLALHSDQNLDRKDGKKYIVAFLIWHTSLYIFSDTSLTVAVDIL